MIPALFAARIDHAVRSNGRQICADVKPHSSPSNIGADDSPKIAGPRGRLRRSSNASAIRARPTALKTDERSLVSLAVRGGACADSVRIVAWANDTTIATREDGNRDKEHRQVRHSVSRWELGAQLPRSGPRKRRLSFIHDVPGRARRQHVRGVPPTVVRRHRERGLRSRAPGGADSERDRGGT